MRKIFACLLAVMLLTVAVSAQAPFVDDASGLLTPAEAENLEAQFSQLYDEYDFTVAVVTTPSMGGEIAAKAAKDAYEAHGYGNDGVLLYICEDEGEWYIYTSGLFSRELPGSVFVEVGNIVTDQLQAGNHFDAMQVFCQMTTKPIIEVCSDYTAQAEHSRSQNGKFLILGLLGGLAAGIAAAVVLGKLAQKPIPKAKKPDPVPETVPTVAEAENPGTKDENVT